MAESPLSNVKLHFVDSIDSLMEMKHWAGERRETPMGVDTESGGLSPWHTRLRSIQLGDKNHGWFVPWERWGGGALEILNSYQGEFTWHNLPHDAKFMKIHAGYDIPWHRTHDTLVSAKLRDPFGDGRLKSLVSKLIDPTALRGQKLLDDAMRQQKWTWDTVPIDFDLYRIYGALDPVLAAHLWEKITPDIQARMPEVYDLEMAAVRIAAKMMLKGMRLDPAYIEVEREKLVRFIDQAKAWLKSEYGVTSVLSAGQISRALTNLGVTIDAFTDAGAPKMDKENLERYRDTGGPAAAELIKYVLAVRHATKIVGTYLDNFVNLADADGILHCNIRTIEAKTGRMSISEPSLQNLPREDKMVRGSFIPREGNVLITCDLDQVEARMMAALSNDEGLIEAFNVADSGGADFFTTIAQMLFNDPTLVKKDPRRQTTKNTMYAKAYGASVRKMAATSGVSYEEVDRVNKLLNERFPGMERIMKKLIEDAMEMRRNGEKPGVRLPSGRFTPCNPGEEYKLLNYDIQGTAAEYLKRSMLNMESAGIIDYMVLPIHDEIIVDAPADEAEDVLRTIQDCMTDRTTYPVPLTAEGKIMPVRWQKGD